MPLMFIPRHAPRESGEMADIVARWLRRVPVSNCTGFDFKIQFQDFGGDRLTRVPFLKLCLEGTFDVLCDPADDNGVGRFCAQPGDALVFAPESFVTIAFKGACRFLRVTVETDGLFVGIEEVGTRLREGVGNAAGAVEATWSEGPLRQPASGLLEHLLDTDPADGERRRALMNAFLWELVERLRTHESARTRPAPFSTVVLRYLQDQHHRPINRETVAQALAVSPGYLGRVIKEATGHSFQTVLNDMRMEHARWLLARSHLSIEEVALRCGFTSGNYFAQAFRRAEGCSPRAWRGR